MNVYMSCPVITTGNFTFRLVNLDDAPSLLSCYNDRAAVELMNDDNCDFGFYAPDFYTMRETIDFWLRLYRQKCFVRFAIVDNKSGRAIGTVEGFGGVNAVLRIDVPSDYENPEALTEIVSFAKDNFREIFGNANLYTKAIEKAETRRKVLKEMGFDYYGRYMGFEDYYKLELK